MNGILAPLVLLGGVVFWATLGAAAGAIWLFTTFPQDAWGPWWGVTCAAAVIAILALGGWGLRRILRWTARA